MNMNDCIRTILSCTPSDKVVTCSSQDYYNESNPEFKEVVDMVKENGKLIILT